MASKIVSFTLDGAEVEVITKPLATLQTILHDQLGQTATRAGCRQGGCGSCTVLLDGQPVLSCLLPVEDAAGRSVETIQTLNAAAAGEELHPLQEAFLENQALQCGFCTSGMLATSRALLEANPDPSRDDIIDALSGNACRCTGLAPIIDAVRDAAGRMTRSTS